MSKHAPGPWATGPLETSEGLRIWQIDKSGNVKGIVGFVIQRKPSREIDEETEANARRIVACVNACEGVDTEWLEQCGGVESARMFSLPHWVKHTDELRAQRDELLAALEWTARALDKKHPAAIKARAAINKVKGQS